MRVVYESATHPTIGFAEFPSRTNRVVHASFEKALELFQQADMTLRKSELGFYYSQMLDNIDMTMDEPHVGLGQQIGVIASTLSSYHDVKLSDKDQQKIRELKNKFVQHSIIQPADNSIRKIDEILPVVVEPENELNTLKTFLKSGYEVAKAKVKATDAYINHYYPR